MIHSSHIVYAMALMKILNELARITEARKDAAATSDTKMITHQCADDCKSPFQAFSLLSSRLSMIHVKSNP